MFYLTCLFNAKESLKLLWVILIWFDIVYYRLDTLCRNQKLSLKSSGCKTDNPKLLSQWQPGLSICCHDDNLQKHVVTMTTYVVTMTNCKNHCCHYDNMTFNFWHLDDNILIVILTTFIFELDRVHLDEIINICVLSSRRIYWIHTRQIFWWCE